MALSEVLLRVPFLVLLEWFLSLDIKQYSDLTLYGRILQLLGKFDFLLRVICAMFLANKILKLLPVENSLENSRNHLSLKAKL